MDESTRRSVETVDKLERIAAALPPALSARPDPQVWYSSTSGGIRLGRAQNDASLAFLEWPADEDPRVLDDPPLLRRRWIGC